MKVTALEIRQKSFEKAFRGYEKEEVEAYLISLSVEWEKNMEEIRDLKIKVDLQEKELQKMREVESSLYKTLKTAETTGSNMVEQANKSAELLLKEAQMKADAILSDAKYQSKNILEEAEAKAKNKEEEAKDQVKIALREIKDVENVKDNLLMELKNLANDTLERVNKMKATPKSNAPVEKPQVTSSVTSGSAATEQPKATNGSFFDSI